MVLWIEWDQQDDSSALFGISWTGLESSSFYSHIWNFVVPLFGLSSWLPQASSQQDGFGVQSWLWEEKAEATTLLKARPRTSTASLLPRSVGQSKSKANSARRINEILPSDGWSCVYYLTRRNRQWPSLETSPHGTPNSWAPLLSFWPLCMHIHRCD